METSVKYLMGPCVVWRLKCLLTSESLLPCGNLGLCCDPVHVFDRCCQPESIWPRLIYERCNTLRWKRTRLGISCDPQVGDFSPSQSSEGQPCRNPEKETYLARSSRLSRPHYQFPLVFCLLPVFMGLSFQFLLPPQLSNQDKNESLLPFIELNEDGTFP